MGEPNLSPADVAASLSFTAEAIRRAIRRGELRAVKVCGRLRTSPEWVNEWLQGRTVHPYPEPTARPSPARSAEPTRRAGTVRAGSFRELARQART